MYISYNWLRQLSGTAITPPELREGLTMVGLAIDAVEQVGDDYVLDVEVPSNRPDCLSHVGIAREVTVIESGKLEIPFSSPARVGERAENFTSVDIRDPDLCPRYAARLVRGVRIGPSPDWLVKRLETIGQRPINNVADITNYVLHELGQPLHAFDFAKLAEHRIVVRRARTEERIRTLDGVERSLDPEMLVIADARSAVAVAGVMGGEDSEISVQTTDVLIESAFFNPSSVRRTARLLGMDTEASRRFERGADYGGVVRAQDRCVELICEFAGGLATENAIDVFPNPIAARTVMFRPSRVSALTALQVRPAEIGRILSALGFSQPDESAVSASGKPANSGDTIAFVVPTWRVDIEREEDLVEEVARHTGYDRIPSELPATSSAGEYQPREMRCRAMRRAFAACGFDEAISFSFIDAGHDDQVDLIPAFVAGTDEVRFVTLRNSIIEGASRMRPTLLPGLLEAVRHNLNHGTKDVRLFETGRVFAASEVRGELPNERQALALVATGGAIEEGRVQAPSEIDFYDVKGALEAAVDALRLQTLRFEKTRAKHLREGQSAAIYVSDGKKIGAIGRLADSIATAYKFRQPVYVAELDLTALLATGERPIHYRPLARYPPVVRDVTLLVERSVTFTDLRQAAMKQCVAECRDIKLVGIYQGQNIPEGKRSITLRFEYRADERTLRDDEVEEMHRHTVDAVMRRFDAELH